MRQPGPRFPAALAAAALLTGCRLPAGSEGPVLWSLVDPAGDDHGDGELRYPSRPDLQPGDLDLLELAALPEKGGTLFEATFARPIARPDGRAFDETGATLEQVAKLGFYTFNLDIYVDVDRLPGSGRTMTLPGRKAEIDPAFAWERAICLTPRPHAARDLLRTLWRREAERAAADRKEVLDSAGERALRARVEEDLDRVFFPTRVHVSGSRVRFFVPEDFLAGRAEARYGYAVIVTGADIRIKFNLAALVGKDAAVQSLFALPIGPGHSLDRFGGGHINDPLQPPIVDILVPPGMSQEVVLKKGPEPGKPVRLPAVVPAETGR